MSKKLQDMQARIKVLQDAMSKTDSDMFEYYALLEIDELEAEIKELTTEKE